MKLEIENGVPQSSFDYYFFKKNAFEMTDDEVGNMLRTGVKFAQDGNRADARHLLLRVTETDPQNETAWLWLASISEYPEELLIFLQNVLKINPENERAIEWSKATQSLLAKTFVQRGIDASHEGQMDFSKQCFLQAIYYDNENEMAWLWLASITEDIEEKIIHLQKVLHLNPENETAASSLKALQKESPQSLLRKANSAAISGDRETAAIMLEEVMQDAPELEEAWILKAYLANDFHEKLGCYERVLALNPQNEAAHAGMTSLRILMDKVETQPVFEPKTEPAAEFSNEENREISQEEESYTSESDIQPTVEFAQEEFEPKVFEVGAVGEKPIEIAEEFSEEFSEDSYSLTDKNETGNQFSMNESFESHSFESETPSVETEASEEFFSEESSPEHIQNLVEETTFHSESQTQKLDNFYFENASHSTESEIELLEEHKEEAGEVFENAENTETEFSLNVDDSEVYLIEDAHLSHSDEPNYGNYVQNEAEIHALTETPENVYETNEQSFTEERPVSGESYELTNSSETVAEEFAPASDYYGSYDQPTVEFSYNEQTEIPAPEQSFEPEAPADHNFNAPDDFVEEQSESAQAFPAMETESSNFVSESYTEQENINCPFCGSSNEAQTISCASCRSILSLSDLEMLLAHNDADREVLTQTVEMMEAEKQMRDFNAEELSLLGIAHLNAKNLRKGFSLLQEASKISPNDVVLSSKVNFLAIRLSEIEAQENKNQENSSASRKILVVDDSPTVRKLISGKLEKSGHSVMTANDGLEALSKMNEIVPDLILLDIAMPQMDGYQVCKMIRSNEATKDIPVVMISGKDGFFDKVRGKMAGSTGYITKPFGPETLMKTLETYIA